MLLAVFALGEATSDTHVRVLIHKVYEGVHRAGADKGVGIDEMVVNGGVPRRLIRADSLVVAVPEATVFGGSVDRYTHRFGVACRDFCKVSRDPSWESLSTIVRPISGRPWVSCRNAWAAFQDISGVL